MMNISYDIDQHWIFATQIIVVEDEPTAQCILSTILESWYPFGFHPNQSNANAYPHVYSVQSFLLPVCKLADAK